MAFNEAAHRTVKRQETERAMRRVYDRMVGQMRLVAQTDEGREVLGYLLVELGDLLRPDVREGRRQLAGEIYTLLDQGDAGTAESILLEARKRRQEDDITIAEAIKQRSNEYGG